MMSGRLCVCEDATPGPPRRKLWHQTPGQASLSGHAALLLAWGHSAAPRSSMVPLYYGQCEWTSRPRNPQFPLAFPRRAPDPLKFGREMGGNPRFPIRPESGNREPRFTIRPRTGIGVPGAAVRGFRPLIDIRQQEYFTVANCSWLVCSKENRVT